MPIQQCFEERKLEALRVLLRYVQEKPILLKSLKVEEGFDGTHVVISGSHACRYIGYKPLLVLTGCSAQATVNSQAPASNLLPDI
jgi:hypothetical protein